MNSRMCRPRLKEGFKHLSCLQRFRYYYSVRNGNTVAGLTSDFSDPKIFPIKSRALGRGRIRRECTLIDTSVSEDLK